jgi:hypothetical protein
MAYPSRDLTYEWGRKAPEQLAQEASALDSKLLGIFSSACIIVGVITALRGNIQIDTTIIPFIIALVSFGIILIYSLWVIRPRWFYVCDSPMILREDYWELDSEDVKDKYWRYVEEGFTDNYKQVKRKGLALSYIIPLLATETVSLLVWLFL